jgi:hypothetical protein
MLTESNKMSKEKMNEMVCHNRQIEQVEKEKLAIQRKQEEQEDIRLDLNKKKFKSMHWKGKSDELEYKMKLVRDYKDFVATGMTREQILAMFPEMQNVVDTLHGSTTK